MQLKFIDLYFFAHLLLLWLFRKNKYQQRLVIIIFCVNFITSCAVGPDYKRPALIVPAKFKEAKGYNIAGKPPKGWKYAVPRDDYNRGAWWRIFQDATLDNLEERLNLSNQTIANAYANYQQARALVAEATANFYPIVTSSYSAIRQRRGSGATSFVTASTGSSGTAVTNVGGSPVSNSQALIIEAAWEPDIWGSVRRSVEAAIGGAQSSAALLASTRLLQQAQLAVFYFQLRGLDADYKLLTDTVVSYKQDLKLTQNQYRAGIIARSNVVQAQEQLETAQAQAIDNGILRAQYEHAIAVLMGEPPSLFGLPRKVVRLSLPSIPVLLPTVLLERRPDIAQAERLAAQANAEIGVAVAAYYPNLMLSASGSNVAQNFAKLFSLPFNSWSYGAQVIATLFDGGLRSATVKAAESAYCASVANYRQVVLTAFQGVEDNLSSLRILQKEVIAQQKAANSATLALKLAFNQYKAGLTDYTTVIVAQTNAYTAQKSAIDSRYLEMEAAVNLVKALGGGWDDQALCCT